MIVQFGDYIVLKEAKDLNDIKINSKNYFYGDIKSNFLKRNYDFLGTIYVRTSRYNYHTLDNGVRIPDCFKKTMTSDMIYLSLEAGEECDERYMHISLSITDGNEDDYDKFEKILSEDNIDKITACYTKKHHLLYYVLWNEDKKYFYFLRIEKGGAIKQTVRYIELWVAIRTEGIDKVMADLEPKALEGRKNREEEKRKEKERREAEEKERVEKERVEKARQEIIDTIKKDVEEHPENYKEVKYGDLPKEIRDDIDKKDLDVEYFKYIFYTGKEDPYMKEDVICYVNKKDLTDGYKYESYVDHGKGHYWGD